MNKVIRNGLLGAAFVAGIGNVPAGWGAQFKGEEFKNIDLDAMMNDGNDVKEVNEEVKGFDQVEAFVNEQQNEEDQKAKEDEERLKQQEEQQQKELEALLKSGSFAEYMKKVKNKEEDEKFAYEIPVEIGIQMDNVKILKNVEEVEFAKSYEYKNPVVKLLSEHVYGASEAENATGKSQDVVNKLAIVLPEFVKDFEINVLGACTGLKEESCKEVVKAFVDTNKASIKYNTVATELVKKFKTEYTFVNGVLTVNGVDCKTKLLDIANVSLKEALGEEINTSELTLNDYLGLLSGIKEFTGVTVKVNSEAVSGGLQGLALKTLEKSIATERETALKAAQEKLANATSSKLLDTLKVLKKNGVLASTMKQITAEVKANLGNISTSKDIDGVIKAAVEKFVKEEPVTTNTEKKTEKKLTKPLAPVAPVAPQQQYKQPKTKTRFTDSTSTTSSTTTTSTKKSRFNK